MKKFAVFLMLIGFGLVGYGAYVSFFQEVSYNVTFNSNGGTEVSSQLVKKGEKANKPTDPTKDGYNFIEWLDGNSKYDFNAVVMQDIKLDASWKEIIKYTVTYKYDGKEEKVTVIEGETLKKPEFKVDEGYRIAWMKGEEEIDITNFDVKENLVLEGKLVKIKTYTVSFNTNGGSTINKATVIEGEKVEKPADPTKKGYLFNDWYLNDKKYNFSDKVTSDLTLEAKWEKDPNVKGFVVSFDTDGGNEIESQEIEDGGKAKKPTDPVKDELTFVRWELNGKAYNFNTPVTENITLKAIWTDKFTVKFNSTGGSKVADQSVAKGGVVKEPKVPTRSGYAFVEWQLDGNKYDFSTKVTESFTLDAVWAKYYTVRFDTVGGSEVASQQVKAGGTAKIPTAPVKDGFTFVKWVLEGEDFSFEIKINSDITLVAIWE